MLSLVFAFFSAGQAEASRAAAGSEGVEAEGWLWMVFLSWCSTLALVMGHLASGSEKLTLGWVGGRTEVVVPTTGQTASFEAMLVDWVD